MPSPLQTLRETNRRLHFWLESVIPNGQPVVATPEHIAALLSELLRAGVGLRTEPIPTKVGDPELDGELNQYRRNLERLRDLMPWLRAQLQAERTRLEAQQSRVQSTAAWARASRQTL
jgi:hypothetical protein